jgi:hypothetical protein
VVGTVVSVGVAVSNDSVGVAVSNGVGVSVVGVSVSIAVAVVVSTAVSVVVGVSSCCNGLAATVGRSVAAVATMAQIRARPMILINQRLRSIVIASLSSSEIDRRKQPPWP